MRTLLNILALIIAISITLPSYGQGRNIPKSKEAREAEAARDAEEKETPLPEGQKYRYPLFNGLDVSVDVMDLMMRLFGTGYGSHEVQVMANFHNRFFPMVAVGMGQANTDSNNGLNYSDGKQYPDMFRQEHTFKTNWAPYFKLGCAYNLKYNHFRPNDFYALFMRYGFSSYTADITNLWYYDGTWATYKSEDLTDQEYNIHWLELGGMIKVQVNKYISMGWDLYYKVPVKEKTSRYGKPYYSPGFGVHNNNVGFLFRVYYNIL